MHTMFERCENDWERHCFTFIVEAHRDGWLGVYDALRSAIMRRPRLTAPTPTRLCMYVKPGEAPRGDVQT